ncbi:hypothetical protein [Aquimarina sp. 2201CG5-10]|uniref:hypothetical protein n=1 Tax=Aquimarina callyspongiae TaxID=3098150 RepID=UPI002AB4904E|nr:hypothetical protein [Aquimarina sp. 2201CG5-10]MDY8136261.1 hypothetical protein [Aquimarina sp. 2201CG5-10]
MRKITLLVLILFSIKQYGQCLSKVQIIYEYKDIIVLNNGKQYQVTGQIPFYEIKDTSILRFRKVDGNIMSLNRILKIQNDKDKEYRELIEWTKDKVTFYQFKQSKSSVKSPKTDITDL